MNDHLFSDIFENHEKHTYTYFNGKEWRVSSSNTTIPVMSPASEGVLGSVQAVTFEEIDEVIALSKKAQLQWVMLPLHKRVAYVRLASEWILQHQDEFVDQLILEIGKSKEESKSEIKRTIDLIEYYVHEVQSITGEYIQGDAFPGFEKGKHALVQRVPHGVILAIAPFNYPINLAVSKIVPALLMGNSVVFKPPTQGSIIGLMLTTAFVKSGLPEGVLSCVTGAGSQIGAYLAGHKDIHMIAFTGSTGVGESIATNAGMIPLLFECGGNNPAIILDSFNEEKTASELVKGAFSYAGQRCTAVKYVLATEHVINTLVPLVVKKTEELVHMGDPRNDETKLVGPLISESAAKETEVAIQDALSQGAELVYGGKRTGWFMEPSILKNATCSMNIVSQEIFGPVLSFITVSDIHEAISFVNQSTYGLQASVFCSDEGAGLVVAEQLSVGTVQINGSPQRGPDHFPFTGIKASGIGTQGVRYSLESMSRLKATVLNNPS